MTFRVLRILYFPYFTIIRPLVFLFSLRFQSYSFATHSRAFDFLVLFPRSRNNFSVGADFLRKDHTIWEPRYFSVCSKLSDYETWLKYYFSISVFIIIIFDKILIIVKLKYQLFKRWIKFYPLYNIIIQLHITIYYYNLKKWSIDVSICYM